MNYEFKINGSILDITSVLQFPFLLSKNVFIRGGLGSSKGISSKTCIFPPTSNNFNIFDKNNEYDNNNKFYTSLKYELIINIEGQNLFKGVFHITKYSKRIGIEGFFISYLTDWVSELAGKNLRDILSIPDEEFKGMSTIEQNNMNLFNLGNNQAASFCFPFISYGTYFLPYWSKQTKYIDTTNYSSIVNNPTELIDGFKLSNSEVPNLNFEDIPPSYFVANIFKAIFKDIGYSVAGAWINSTNLNNMILPTIKEERVKYNWGELCDIKIEATNIPYSNIASDFIDSSSTPVSGINFFSRKANSLIDTGHNMSNPYIFGDFFVPEDGIYEFSYDMDITSKYSITSGATFRYPIIGFFLVNPDFSFSIVESQTLVISGSQNWYRMNLFDSYKLVDLFGNPIYDEIILPPLTSTDIFTTISRTFQSNLKRNDIIRMCFITDTFTPISVMTFDFTLLDYSIKCISGDKKFKIAQNLPDISQIDFIRSFIKQENLYFDVDASRKVITFEKRDDFYLGIDVATDITEYCNELFAEILPNEVPKKYIFSYIKDTDDFLDLNSEHEVPMKYQELNENQRIESIFAATGLNEFIIVLNELPLTVSSLQNPAFKRIKNFDLPIIADKARATSLQFPTEDIEYEAWTYNYTPRILILQGFEDFSSIFSPGITARKWDYGLNSDVLSALAIVPKAIFEPLKWENLILSWDSFLYLIQHSHYINISIKINVNLWNEIKSNVPIKINQNYYILQEIGDFRILEKNSKVEITLLKLV